MNDFEKDDHFEMAFLEKKAVTMQFMPGIPLEWRMVYRSLTIINNYFEIDFER